MLTDLFKPKSKSDILDEIKIMDEDRFKDIESNFRKFFMVDLPIDCLPLFSQLYRVLNNRGWNGNPIRVKRTVLSIHRWNKSITVDMFPCRRIKDIEHIRHGNTYIIDSLETFVTMIDFLEKNP